MSKKCFYCGSKQTKENGKIGSIQLYKCNKCGKQFRDIKQTDVNA